MISGFTTGRWSNMEAQGEGDGELLLFYVFYIINHKLETTSMINVRQYAGYSIVNLMSNLHTS